MSISPLGASAGANANRFNTSVIVRTHVEPLIHRLDEEVAYEADHQQPGHDVHGGVVGLRLRHAVIDVVLADIVHQHRTEDAGHRPGRQQQAVDGADIARSEHVPEIGRHGGEASAVHADDHQEGADEPDHAADRSRVGHRAIQHEAEHHEHEVGVAPADIVRRGRPEEAAAHVEQTHYCLLYTSA